MRAPNVSSPPRVLKSGQKGYKWSDQQRARFKATREAQFRAKKLLEKAQAQTNYQPTDEETAPVIEIPPKPKRRPSTTMLYALAQHAREAIHEHVRRGGQLESLHTTVLALTDALMKGEEE